jgi:hypothetical protein
MMYLVKKCGVVNFTLKYWGEPLLINQNYRYALCCFVDGAENAILIADATSGYLADVNIYS